MSRKTPFKLKKVKRKVPVVTKKKGRRKPEETSVTLIVKFRLSRAIGLADMREMLGEVFAAVDGDLLTRQLKRRIKRK